ncbi:MAG: glycogen-binding domain-containing protein [Verrucomicrobiae bacterium]|nr:glycogen-binding domain-containing protein [Verrucomicrobiae bacterium]
MEDDVTIPKGSKRPRRRKTPMPPPLPPEATARVSAAAAAAAAVQPATPLSPTKTAAVKRPVSAMRRVEVVFDAPEAQQVMIAGDFNGWEATTMPLAKSADGRWRITLNLKPGTYQYRFVRDGEWVNDPNNLNVAPNPFGSLNNVLEVS